MGVGEITGILLGLFDGEGLALLGAEFMKFFLNRKVHGPCEVAGVGDAAPSYVLQGQFMIFDWRHFVNEIPVCGL